MEKLQFALLAFCLGYQGLFAQTGCSGCVINLPNIPEDTIYLSEAPQGQTGQFYDADISFRLPKSTDPVNDIDPSTPRGIGLNRITILDVANVPPGLSWEANQLEFDVREQTDGCVKFCGIPLLPGIYEVEVVIEARVSFINQKTSFSFPMEIRPSETITEGFTLLNQRGCEELMATFINNVPSNGQTGIEYAWDFGNGQTSEAENPGTILFDGPGSYPIQYQAIIDTVGYILDEITINEVDCDDFLGRPDLDVKIIDSEGTEVFLSNTFQNARLPVVVDLNLLLDTGDYVLQVIDDDSGLEGGDKICGEVTFNRQNVDTLRQENFEAILSILNPRDTIRSLDTVIVQNAPAVPSINVEERTNNLSPCQGDTVILSIEASGEIQWYQDSLPTGGDNSLLITESGDFWAVTTNEFGCSSTSEVLSFDFPELPNEPVFVNANNLLSIFDEARLPEQYQLQWFFNDGLIENETETSFCVDSSGNYRLEVLDLSTGCTRSFGRNITFDPAFAGCITTSIETPIALESIRIYPNPSPGVFWMEASSGDLIFNLFNSQGQRVSSHDWSQNNKTNETTWQIDLSRMPAGIYWLKVIQGRSYRTYRLMKQ